MRVAIVQLCSTDDVERNLEHAREGVAQAAALGAEFVALPEAFAFLRREGTAIPDAAALERRVLSELAVWARTNAVWLLGGSLLGMPLGALLLVDLPAVWLRVAVGSIDMGFCALLLSGRSAPALGNGPWKESLPATVLRGRRARPRAGKSWLRSMRT